MYKRQHLRSAQDFMKVGDEVEAVVLTLDREERKMSLGIKQLDVYKRQIYISALSMPHLQPYLEVGYGIGTHIFDVGVFVSSENWKFGGIGCKFTFELFNR